MAKTIVQQPDGSVIVTEITVVGPPVQSRSWSYGSIAELKKQEGELTQAELDAAPLVKAALAALDK
jgi:hypothetical protein